MYRVILSLCVLYLTIRYSSPREIDWGNLTTFRGDSVSPMHKIYSPHYGYEAYWNGSMLPITTEKNMRWPTTSKKLVACGKDCHNIYLRMGKVCAHQVSKVSHQGCDPYYKCAGGTHGDIMGNFKTYDNYCQYLDSQCSNVKYDQRWVFVHMGNCKAQTHYFKERYKVMDLPKDLKIYNVSGSALMKHWIDEYNNK